jgi:hypothetical protein
MGDGRAILQGDHVLRNGNPCPVLRWGPPRRMLPGGGRLPDLVGRCKLGCLWSVALSTARMGIGDYGLGGIEWVISQKGAPGGSGRCFRSADPFALLQWLPSDRFAPPPNPRLRTVDPRVPRRREDPDVCLVSQMLPFLRVWR